MHILRKALPLALVLALLGSIPVATAVAPNNVVKVRDYARGDCTVDDTAAIQAAINAWRNGQLTRTAGTLDFGSGCYQVDGTLMFTPPAGAVALYGTVKGDGPEITTINGRDGVTTAIVRDFKYGTFGGLKFRGRPAFGNQWADLNANHVGLMLGSTTAAMGTNGATFHNLTFEHYYAGLVVGDYQTGGSAAELIFRNVGISQSHWGVNLVSFNTLDNLFEQLNVAETDRGVRIDNAYGTQFVNGAGGNNYTTFLIQAPGETIIDGWREEYGPLTHDWIEYGSPAADHHLVVRASTTVDAVSPHRANLEAIHILTPAASLLLEGSLINGSVDGKKVTVLNTSFTGATNIKRYAGQWRTILQSCMADINNGQCVTDIPPEITGIKSYPP